MSARDTIVEPRPTAAPGDGDFAKRHLNQEQLARRWGLSPRTLERWRSIGTGPNYLRLGGRIAYRLVDIELFEERGLRVISAKPLPRGGQ